MKNNSNASPFTIAKPVASRAADLKPGDDIRLPIGASHWIAPVISEPYRHRIGGHLTVMVLLNGSEFRLILQPTDLMELV